MDALTNTTLSKGKESYTKGYEVYESINKTLKTKPRVFKVSIVATPSCGREQERGFQSADNRPLLGLGASL